MIFVCLPLFNDSYYFVSCSHLQTDTHSIHPLKLHPSLLFTDSSILGFKIVCSNLAVTAIRLVEDWETNTCCHLSACLSFCLPAWTVRFLTSDRFPAQQSASSADLNRAFVLRVGARPNVQALQVSVRM